MHIKRHRLRCPALYDTGRDKLLTARALSPTHVRDMSGPKSTDHGPESGGFVRTGLNSAHRESWIYATKLQLQENTGHTTMGPRLDPYRERDLGGGNDLETHFRFGVVGRRSAL